MNNFVYIFVVCLFLISSSSGLSKIRIQDGDDPVLTGIMNRINATSAISQSSLGDSSVWQYLLEALEIGMEIRNELLMYHIHFELSNQNGNEELFVSGQTTIWNQTQIDISFVFFVESGLKFALQFGYNGTAIPVTLWPAKSTAWFSGLTLVGDNTVTISSATFTDNKGNSYQQGLTFIANVQTNEELPIQQSLYPLIHGPSTMNPVIYKKVQARVPITGKLVAQFPLSEGQDLTHWTFTVDGTIYFSSPNVVSNNLEINFQIMSNLEAQITLQTQMTVKNLGGPKSGTLQFDITSTIDTESGFTFNGNLDGTWQNAFGYTWMSFSTLSVNFAFNPLQTPTIASLTFNGGMNLAFSDLKQPISISFDGQLSNDVQQIELIVTVPVVDLTQLFDSVLGKKPPLTSELTTTGQVNFALSTYDGQYQKGFTIKGEVDVQSTGSIAKAIKTIDASPASWTYDFQLYIPIFSTNPQDIDFYLTETGPITLSPTLKITGYHIEFDLTPSEEVDLALNLQYTSPHESLAISLTGEVDQSGTSNTISFSGSIQGTWNNPFGLSWLKLQDVSISMTITNGQVQAFSFQGQADLTFGDSASGSVQIIIPGPTFSEFSFTIDVLISDMQKFLQSVAPSPSDVPSVTNEISVTAGLTVSTYAHDSVVAGISLTGNAIVSPSGTIANAILTFNPQSSMYFSIEVVLPIFSSSPWDVTFAFTEKGTYPLNKNIILSSFSVDFHIGENPLASVSADAQVTLEQNPTPFLIDFSASLGGSSILSLTGSIKGNWKPYPDITWFTATSATATLTITDKALQGFGISGSCDITVAGNTTASFSLQTADDFFNSYIKINTISSINLGQFVKAVFNKNLPSYIANIASVTNTFSFILSTYSSGDIKAGLTFDDKVTIHDALAQQFKVFNAYNQISSSTYEMGLTLPVFPNQVPNVALVLKTPTVRIAKNIVLEDVQLELDSVPPKVAVDAQLKVNFSKNPELEFDIGGAFSGTSVQISGSMIGKWNNMFGVNGLSLSNVQLAAGFDAVNCASSFCISALGLGYNVTIGDSDIAFYGYSSLDILADVFLDASVTGKNGMALNFRDVALEWNKMIGNELKIPINTNNIPADWGFEDTHLYIAPEAGTFNNMKYQQGFWIDSGFKMFGIDCDVDIQVTSNDFSFAVNISVGTFEADLKKQIHLMLPHKYSSPDVVVLSVQTVNLGSLSAWNYGHNQNPLFSMDYTFMGGNNHFKTNVPVLQLYDSFQSFFQKFLSHLFN